MEMSVNRGSTILILFHSYLSENLFADSKRQIQRSRDVIFRHPGHALVKERVHRFNVTQLAGTEIISISNQYGKRDK